MASQRYRRTDSICRPCLVYLVSLLLAAPVAAGHRLQAEYSLWLEVILNGHPTHLVAEFQVGPSGALLATGDELRKLGFAQPAADDPVPLGSIAGLTYTYDAASQTIALNAPATVLAGSRIDARPAHDPPAVQSGRGVVVNYAFYGSVHEDLDGVSDLSGAANLRLDTRGYAPAGTLASSAIIGKTPHDPITLRRLDTSWSKSFPETATTWTVGDVISSGLPWTRPVRIGGLQLRRNFDLRPDLVTAPLQSFEGTAAVPSTVDIFVNDIRTYSGDVPAGPFTIDNVHVGPGTGTARVVVRDVTGRETETVSSIFAPAKLLRRGLLDFAVEAGLPRRGYGTANDAYVAIPVAGGSIRYGLSDRVTLEGHVELAGNLMNAGAGVVSPVGSLGVASLAAGGSVGGAGTGGFVQGAVEVVRNGVSLRGSTHRVFGRYADLASVTAASGSRPRSVDSISVGFSEFPLAGSGVRLGYIRTRTDTNEVTDLVQATLSGRLTDRASAFLSGYAGLAAERSYGVHAGVSVSLASGVHTSANAALDEDGPKVTASAAKSAPPEPGGFGWRVRASGLSQPIGEADVTYYTDTVRTVARVAHQNGAVAAAVSLDGGFAVTERGAFPSHTIDDAFAVVDAKDADLPVYLENRLVGRTGKDGKLLVTGLRSYETNHIRVDPLDLPVTADIRKTSFEVTPADRHGVIVEVGFEDQAASALVAFLLADGSAPPVGSEILVHATGETFVMGYDGLSYLSGLAGANDVTVDWLHGSCSASFAFRPRPDDQVLIEGVPCR